MNTDHMFTSFHWVTIVFKLTVFLATDPTQNTEQIVQESIEIHQKNCADIKEYVDKTNMFLSEQIVSWTRSESK